MVIGAFGSDHERRPELPHVAQRRARESLGLDVTVIDWPGTNINRMHGAELLKQELRSSVAIRNIFRATLATLVSRTSTNAAIETVMPITQGFTFGRQTAWATGRVNA